MSVHCAWETGIIQTKLKGVNKKLVPIELGPKKDNGDNILPIFIGPSRPSGGPGDLDPFLTIVGDAMKNTTKKFQPPQTSCLAVTARQKLAILKTRKC